MKDENPKSLGVNGDSVCDEEPLVALTEVAKIAPGRPSTNCIWRWCRRGVRSRSGERVRLQHVRIGGRIYTKLMWLGDFASKLAESDSRYFDSRDAADGAQMAQHRRRRRAPADFERERLRAIEGAEQELADAGM